LAVTHRRVDADTGVIELEGDLELTSAPRLKRVLLDLRRSGQSRFVLDFSRVTFFDSTGLGVLIAFNRTLGEGEVLAIAGAGRAVVKVFEMTGVRGSLNLFPSVDAALEHIWRMPHPIARPENVDERDREGIDLASDRAAEEFASSSTEPADLLTSLTEDAALVLGIASTAIPFAASIDAQAEQWFRALQRSGDAGSALMSLGASDGPRRPAADPPEAERPSADAAGSRDPVDAVTRTARRIAGERNHRAIHTTDLLGAVMDIYGHTFNHVLMRHGIDSQDLMRKLGSAPRGGRPGSEDQ
jgi:anti-sigma B factor antagonist